ncbi:MAG: LysR family transcriptional regulator [Gaiellales bacterium]
MLKRIEGFVEVARRGNVSRAAEALFLTQPALTACLKSLEGELGVTLLVRSGRGVGLTDAGHAFLPYAERAIEAVTEGRRLIGELERGGTGQLALGAAPAVSTYVLPTMLERFHSAHPGVQLSVRTGHSEEVLEMVVRRQVQVGLVRAMHHPDVVSLPLYEDELVLVVEPGHELARRGGIQLEQLAGETLILFDRTSSYHDLTSAFFHEAGVVARSVMELDNIDATKKMVGQGLGVALLPHTAVADELAAGRLAAVRILDAAPIRRRIVAVHRRELAAASGVVAAFLDTLADMRPDLRDAGRWG